MRRLFLVTVLVVLAAPAAAYGYSVLTHEAIIDAAWDRSIAPALRARFRLSPTALRDARAYAYGGAIIQDLGYYPFSSKTFGDFVHYVRSGDFIVTLLRDARDPNEYAFALGALAHYAADNDGHTIAINRSVPLLFPKLGAKFGARMTYEQDPAAHLRTEFAFDVLQVARGAYKSDAYHDFIGFKVSKPLLERAFEDTFGLPLEDVFGNFDLAVGTFRWAVGGWIPELTKVAWATKQDAIRERMPGVTVDTYLFQQSREDFESHYGHDYRRPNLGHRLLAGLLWLVPKIGPFRALKIEPPTPETERLFLASFQATLDHYGRLLDEVRSQRLSLPDRNFDTGEPTAAGAYQLADDAYATLVNKLADREFATVTPVLRANILRYYANPEAPIATKAHRKEWAALQTELGALRSARLTAR